MIGDVCFGVQLGARPPVGELLHSRDVSAGDGIDEHLRRRQVVQLFGHCNSSFAAKSPAVVGPFHVNHRAH